MKKVIILIVLYASGLTSCSVKNVNLKFVPLTQFNYLDSTRNANGKMIYNKIDNYIVENFRDNKKSALTIDSFANSLKNESFKKVSGYQIVFFKHSSITDINHLRENPRDLDRHSQDNDLIRVYNWVYGTYVGREIWHNGEIIDPKSNITVEDVY
jgi:hypothetical protein